MPHTADYFDAIVTDALVHVTVEFLSVRREQIRETDNFVALLLTSHQIVAAVFAARDQSDYLHLRVQQQIRRCVTRRLLYIWASYRRPITFGEKIAPFFISGKNKASQTTNAGNALHTEVCRKRGFVSEQ